MRCFRSLNGQRSALMVQGPPGAGFDWEVKAKQAGHEARSVLTDGTGKRSGRKRRWESLVLNIIKNIWRD